MEKIKIIFHFNSGETIEVEFQKETFQKLKKSLATEWNKTSSTGETFGINFSTVTYYKVLS
jgi:hypothetical protein